MTHPDSPAGPAEVITVHGLWNRGPELAVLRKNLARRLGLPVTQFSYDTRRAGLEEVIEDLAEFAVDRGRPTVHFVGHSLGGLLVLNALLSRPMPPGRAVLLGSPVNGAETLSAATRLPGASRLTGGLLPEALARTPYTAPFDREIGVVAGDRSLGLGRLVRRFRGPNDGTVAVAETRLTGGAHHRVRASHTGLLFSGDAAVAAANFLRSGLFVP